MVLFNGKSSGDAVYSDKINYSTSDRLLFDVRRYMRAIVALHVIFVTIVVITFGLVWHQISQYDITKADNINSINDQVHSILQAVVAMTMEGVPITQNINYMTQGMAAAAAVFVNSSSNVFAVPSRSLLAVEGVPITNQDLLEQDFRLRKMMYSQVRQLLQSGNDQLDAFNMTALSEFLDATASQIRHVNFTGLARRYDGAMVDAEQVAKFGLLATSMMGVASQIWNTSLPSAATVGTSFAAQQILARKYV
jgi:hypothetical protein